MTRFAQGTNQDYANAYNSWWFGGAGGPPPQRGAFGQDTPARPGYTAGLTAKQPGYGSYRPGMAQAMQPNGGGSPYAPQKQPSVGGWPDPSGSGRRPAGGGAPYGRSPAGLRAGPAATWEPGMQDFIAANPNMDVREFFAANPEYLTAPMKSRDPQPGGGLTGLSPTGAGRGQPSFGYTGTKQTTTAPTFKAGGGQGNLAYASPDNRPQPFTQSVNFMGQPVDPSQFYGQRDAFINNINAERSKFAQNPAGGRPKMNFGGMWNQAGDMVGQGWQNPLQGLMY